MKKKSKKMQTVQETNPPYTAKLAPGDRYTMEDSGTKLYIRASHHLRVIEVDDGIIKSRDTKKCDFLCEVWAEKCVHLFEFKTGKMNDAFLQLEMTPKAIQEHSEYKNILDDLNRLDAYIVSPLRLQIPKNINEKQRRLCGTLARYCNHKLDDIMDLLRLVRVVSTCKKTQEDAGTILCSNSCPLKL